MRDVRHLRIRLSRACREIPRDICEIRVCLTIAPLHTNFSNAGLRILYLVSDPVTD
jgi:hypothetical protein